MILLQDHEITKLTDQFEALVKKVDSLLMNEIKDNAVFSIDEVCSQLNVCKRTLQKYRDEGKISYSHVGDKIFFQRSDIDAFLSCYRVEAFAQKGGSYVC